MSDMLLNAQKVSFQYDNAEADQADAADVLHGIDLAVERGSFVALLGHNGCGKSTLAKHFNAILLPTGGKVWVDGIDTCDEDKRLQVRSTVGMVLQNPDNQLVSTIVEEDVAFGPENLGVDPKEIRRRVDEALLAVNMYDYRRHSVYKLSGGQKQRVAIAGILAMQPDCIVLDEPTAMLDPQGRAEVMETVCRLNREQGITVVLITHYMEEAARAQRVVVMDGGKILLDGTPREVFCQVETLRSVALDVPQPTDLCWRLRRLGLPLPADILTEDECIEALAHLMEDAHAHS
ncbi:MAG: energy-coupling factor transporter ATPase [Acutalibacteraceae bacterium]